MSEELEAYYGLPKEVKYCKKCTISNQRPSSAIEFKHTIKSKKTTIGFDEEGVCSACRYAEMKKNIDWEDRERQLRELLDRYRRDDGGYDVLVPGSGGKDSFYAAYVLKHKYKMNPLTVTWAPHIYTWYGRHNFDNWLEAGLDNILVTPNPKVHRLLTRLAFKNLLHPFQPFILGQKNLAPKTAKKFGITLVMYGEPEAEYGNPIKEVKVPKRSKEYFTYSELEELYLSGVKITELIDKYGLTLNDIQMYLPPSEEEAKSIEVHYLGYYLKWDPQTMYYFSAEHSNFTTNDQRTMGTYSKYNSLDDKIDDFHYFTTYIKFGIGRTTYDTAQEIRNGHITRDEGIALIKKYDGEVPKRYFKELLEYLDMDEKEFWETVDKFRSPHLWKKENGKWKLRYPIWEVEKDWAKRYGVRE